MIGVDSRENKDKMRKVTSKELYILCTEGTRSVRRADETKRKKRFTKVAIQGPMKSGTKIASSYLGRFFDLDDISPKCADVAEPKDKSVTDRREEGIVRIDENETWKHASLGKTQAGYLHVCTVRELESWKVSFAKSQKSFGITTTDDKLQTNHELWDHEYANDEELWRETIISYLTAKVADRSEVIIVALEDLICHPRHVVSELSHVANRNDTEYHDVEKIAHFGNTSLDELRKQHSSSWVLRRAEPTDAKPDDKPKTNPLDRDDIDKEVVIITDSTLACGKSPAVKIMGCGGGHLLSSGVTEVSLAQQFLDHYGDEDPDQEVEFFGGTRSPLNTRSKK